MSNALGLAAVSWVLKDLLNEGLINSQVADVVSSGNVRVTTLPPLRELDGTQSEQPQLNLFLYHLSPNLGWRNAGLPAFDARGTRTSNPPLALDLHYLLTAYAQHPLHAEVLLGYAMQLLHETPVFTRGAIRGSLLHNVGDGGLPDALRQLPQSGLADQIEAIKITPQAVSADEMSKLWTGFQAPYRPSVAYLVTTVLIESAKPARSALPVLRVGGDARGPVAQPSLFPPLPTLLAVRAPDYQPAARVGDTIFLFGRHLEGTERVVVLRHAALNLELTISEERLHFSDPPQRDDLGEGGNTFELPDDIIGTATSMVQVDLSQARPRTNWAPGFYTVELRVRTGAEPTVRTSNALALAVAATILVGAEAPVATSNPVDRNEVTVRLRCIPPVRTTQRLSLVLGDHELPGGTGPHPDPSEPQTLEFTTRLPTAMLAQPDSPAPLYLLRLRVDGVESLLVGRSRPSAPPEFDRTQSVTMPPLPPPP